jgi:hypothetical protein
MELDPIDQRLNDECETDTRAFAEKCVDPRVGYAGFRDYRLSALWREAEDRVLALEEAVLDAQWAGDYYDGLSSSCPWCGNEQSEDHAQDCIVRTLKSPLDNR